MPTGRFQVCVYVVVGPDKFEPHSVYHSIYTVYMNHCIAPIYDYRKFAVDNARARRAKALSTANFL